MITTHVREEMKISKHQTGGSIGAGERGDILMRETQYGITINNIN